MRKKFPVLFFSAALFAGCSSQPAFRTVTLPSGKAVRVLGVGPMRFNSGSTALMLKYQTDLKISDREALRKEVDEIWSSFRVDADKGNFQSAIISANEIPQGMILKSGQAYNFVYEKTSDGQWQLVGDKN
jgi:hypothetical protein